MKTPKFITNNLILKITSLNSLVVGSRLIISLVVQNLLAQYTGQAGIAKVGQLRNLSSILMSLTSFGTFNGVVKYVSDYKSDKKTLLKCKVFLVVPPGIEPGTQGFSVLCSTNWAMVPKALANILILKQF